MKRRNFMRNSAAAFFAAGAGRLRPFEAASRSPHFSTASPSWQLTYDKALRTLSGNVWILPGDSSPVLVEGSSYPGIWQECGPFESLVYRVFRPDVARNSHMTFFASQYPDGQLPALRRGSEISFGQIQMVVPIAATAWELAQFTGDQELLQRAYESCSRWDAWLLRYRNTRGTGLVEGFCTWDTGHDNSPRWAGMPNQCPGADARVCSSAPGLPRLCPDLSATVYGARVGLAAMARALGKGADADRWTESAALIRRLILEKLYVPEDAAFYDLDAQGRFVRIRSDVLSRVCGEHVVGQQTFDSLWERQFHNPKAFWAPYPLPSIALDDPAFVRPIPPNSWGGASQALTALRAPRWFEFYGKPTELALLMTRWCETLQRNMSFRPQIDPLTGEFTSGDLPAYSPSALAMVDFTWRLAGVREEQDRLEWNVRPTHAAARRAHFSLPFGQNSIASLSYDDQGATLRLNGRTLCRIESGTARLITSKQGQPLSLLGIGDSIETVVLQLHGGPPRRLLLNPNQQIPLG
jgi:Bacterial alpha-L-rhamnosidase 6 hairpin glycosidase domain